MTALPSEGAAAASGYVGRIPVRNLWLLMLYASELFRMHGTGSVSVEESPDDLPEIIAEILVRAVDKRLRRQPSFGYEPRHDVLSRVRGRIDLLTTARHQLSARGLVACRFEELTFDTPRNRLVRGALASIARQRIRTDLSRRCRAHAETLAQYGVSSLVPDRRHRSNDRFGYHDADDRFMVAAARLALDLALPTELPGAEQLALPEREIAWVRKLYEKAVGGFYEVVLTEQGWRVEMGRSQSWQITHRTAGIDSILPGMRTDIVLDHPKTGRRIVIDTKFNSVLTSGWYREEAVRSQYLYQIYAYLRSQVGCGDPLAETAAGMLLHPSVGESVDETVVIQGHPIRFATVDLAAPAKEIRARLCKLVVSAVVK